MSNRNIFVTHLYTVRNFWKKKQTPLGSAKMVEHRNNKIKVPGSDPGWSVCCIASNLTIYFVTRLPTCLNPLTLDYKLINSQILQSLSNAT